MDQLQELNYFTSTVYAVKKPEFLDSVRKVSDNYLSQSKERKKKEKHIVLMSGNYAHEPEIAEFTQYVSQTAWNILSAQGYDMEHLVTFFTEMWTQEHNSLSSMDSHVHGRGSQISAFYFLDAPEHGCQLMIHDPRPAKVIINLPEADQKQITPASQHVLFKVEPGMLLLCGAWLPHSFTKNFSKDPVRFVHMNLSVAANPVPRVSEPEVV